MSPEEDRTRDTVDSEPKHYQLSYSGPQGNTLNPILFDVLFTDTTTTSACAVLSLLVQTIYMCSSPAFYTRAPLSFHKKATSKRQLSYKTNMSDCSSVAVPWVPDSQKQNQSRNFPSHKPQSNRVFKNMEEVALAADCCADREDRRLPEKQVTYCCSRIWRKWPWPPTAVQTEKTDVFQRSGHFSITQQGK